MNKQKLDKWAELLLDTGKRNNLINFRDAKAATVEVLKPDFSTLFDKADNAATLEVFSPLQADEDGRRRRKAVTTDQPQTREEYVKAYSDKLKKGNQILVYNAQSDPIAALKNIGKRAKSAMEETGVNIAYMAFGFIEWKEHRNSDCSFKAPVLLAPVSVETSSPLDPVYVKITDDILLNPTFAFKLQNEYNVKLPDYKDEGVSYIKKVAAIARRLGWSVSFDCKIGVFSFLKINMYRDIMDNGEVIANNINVRALNGEAVESAFAATATVNTNDEPHNVVDADSSQEKAVMYAREGKSFVLQGPPGTGKSQTITNIIAECLATGKKVLFVAEKLAALNVVYNKLKDAGLSEFCLQLHSHKANKKAVIGELCSTLRISKSELSSRAATETASMMSAREQLDDYDEELHKTRPVIDKSLYELLESVACYRNAPEISYTLSVADKGQDFLTQTTDCLSQFAEYRSTVGKDYRANVWYGYVNTDSSHQKTAETRKQLKALRQMCLLLYKLSATLSNDYGFTIKSIAAAEGYRKFFKCTGRSDTLTPALLDKDTIDTTLDIAKQMQHATQIVLKTKEELDETYDDDLFKLDGKTMHKRLIADYRTAISRMSVKYGKIVKDIQRCRTDGKKVRYTDAVKTTGLLREYQEQLSFLHKCENTLNSKIGSYDGLNTDWDKVVAELSEATDYVGQLEFGSLAKLTNEQFSAKKMEFNTVAGWLDAAFSDDDAMRLIADYDKSQYDITGVSLAETFDKISKCLAATDSLDNWRRFCCLTDKLEKLGVIDFVNKALDANVPLESLDKTFAKMFYTQWVDDVLQSAPVLSQLSRIPHDKLVETFAEKDLLQFEINKAAIKAQLSATRPSLEMISARSQVSALLREGEKKRKQKGIRQLFADTWALTQTLKPCFLMSPLSVSTFLGADMTFDVVIFDEASQIFPQDAVGAIYRGKQLIVVGDGQQMPPSNFFNAIAEGDDETDDDDITDYESILDLCSTTLPQLRLKWHYRSRFEQLIAFSNKNYYDNELVTFPSSQRNRKGFGVDYYHVDGLFDRTKRTNFAEAEFIVDLIFENFKRYPSRSVGVVTFSVSQQDLVDKLLAKRRQVEPNFEEFFRPDKDEPFFVKNLETVQGDERDTIILGVAYGRDGQGRLLHNFGPLNRAGGERRLNVAVTRAKLNVQVVSSMHATDIDLTKTQSVGAKLLKEYLDYAEHGTTTIQSAKKTNPFEKYDFALENEICEFLRANGYDAETQVGCSAFKVDIAVKPQRSVNYVLAIECDGRTYHSSKATRDRDRLRQSILQRMGWSYYRVWSTDWFRNKKIEKERLLEAVAKAVGNKNNVASAVAPHESFETHVETPQFEFARYVNADIDKLQSEYGEDFLGFLRAVLETEAPIAEDVLLKKIVKVFGREKVTKAVVAEWENRLKGCSKYNIVRRKGFVYLRDKTEYAMRVSDDDKQRNVNDIATEELAAGLLDLVRYSVAIDKTSLFNKMAQYLGYSRAGDAMTTRLNEALYLIRKDIDTDGDVITLK